MSVWRQSVLDLVPQIRGRAEKAEKDRRIPAETIADLRRLGLFRAFVPRAYGGDERPLSEVLDAMTDLAVGCGSTAWVGALAAIHNVAVSWLEKDALEEIFADGPDVLVASSVAPTGTMERATGGFVLGGRWGFSSGADHASWFMLGAELKGSNGQARGEYFLTFVRAKEVTLIDDWQVAGLRATGSKSLQLNNVFVPARRAIVLKTASEAQAAAQNLHGSPFYRLPWNPLFVSAFPPAALGTAIAMLECFRAYTAARVNRFSGRSFRLNAGAAMRVAEAAAQIDAARLLFRRDLAVLDRFALDGKPFDPGAVERIPYDVPFVVDACSRAVLALFRGSGGRAVHDTNPLQRYFRDIHAMTQHAALDLDGAGETYGGLLFQNPTSHIGVPQLLHAVP
jgi:3-hydroxy-9,10-secoandrosta-1,3,5(10)-triene-9,17-dione monooxygenase